MPRFARVVAPGVPHHVTQRGNRKQRTFFNEEDYRAYINITSRWCRYFDVEIWAYCLMPNHVHLIAVPERADSLGLAMRETHRRYSLRVNRENGWCGFLWQGRYASFPMDDAHLVAAIRYVELNPVRAGLVDRPEDYPWSSASAHVAGKQDSMVSDNWLLRFVGDWSDFLDESEDESVLGNLRGHARTGRPLGSDSFIDELERETGRMLRRRNPGPRAKKDISGRSQHQDELSNLSL